MTGGKTEDGVAKITSQGKMERRGMGGARDGSKGGTSKECGVRDGWQGHPGWQGWQGWQGPHKAPAATRRHREVMQLLDSGIREDKASSRMDSGGEAGTREDRAIREETASQRGGEERKAKKKRGRGLRRIRVAARPAMAEVVGGRTGPRPKNAAGQEVAGLVCA